MTLSQYLCHVWDKKRMESASESLTVDIKATIALIITFMVYFVVGIIVTLLTGPLDIYALASLVFLIPFGVLLYFCRERKSQAYIGDSILGIILIAAIPLNASYETWQQTTPFLMSMSTIGAVLLALMALEGFKAYVELKKS